ncbi:MAG: hypothetical protein JO353_10440, partial [Phycisphaerae bacterium]|nr:hypothetical protein [Phycisphaerae bacterium]
MKLNFSKWNQSIVALAVPAVLAAAGCQHKAADGVPSASVTDLSAPAPAPAPAMATYTPAPAQPVYDSAPATPAPVSYAANTGSAIGGASAMGGTYTVKKGDTLFGIAR